MHWPNSQSKVRYHISDLNVVDVLVAEFRESIRSAIPQMITLLNIGDLDICMVVANALVKLSEQGRVSIF